MVVWAWRVAVLREDDGMLHFLADEGGLFELQGTLVGLQVEHDWFNPTIFEGLQKIQFKSEYQTQAVEVYGLVCYSQTKFGLARIVCCQNISMGICMNKEEEADVREQPKNKNIQTQIQSVDVVKMKLKQARDKIKGFIAKKQADVAQLDLQIKEKLPEYERTKNKKEIVPLLKAKKDLLEIVEKGDVRLRLVNDKLAEVELQQLNKETIDVLDDSNKYIREVQDVLEAKDWRNVLAEAQQKVEIQWPDDREEIQEDPAFLKMWQEVGGNKLPKGKEVSKKSVNVEVTVKEKENLAYA